MRKTMVFLVALMAMGLGPVGLAGCSDDTAVTDDGGGDEGTSETEGGGDGDADGDGDAEAEASCVPSCNTSLCEACVDGSCVDACEAGERCDGSGTCITGLMTLGGPCAADADCATGLCFTEYTGWAGGFCTAACDDTACATGICVPTMTGSYCAPDCSSVDCRPGLACQTDSTTGDQFCWAGCTENWQCTTTNNCNVDDGWCYCPVGQHLNDDSTACVYDDCAFLACDTTHRGCNATGGCSGSCAACEGCEPTDYVESTNHCYPTGATWGGPCTTDADCPGTGVPGADTSCWADGHGNCVQVGGPDAGVEGSPCTGDPGSVTITLYDMSGNPYPSCLQACTTDTDCEPGLRCEVGGTTGDIQHCWPIRDCTTVADCNAPAGELYCSADGSCYVNGCNPNPCATLANSTGECVNVVSDYRCGCAPGNVWNGGTHTCDAYTCPATAATVGATVTGDTCTGTTQYDPGASTVDCTGYAELGNELVYSLEVPASSMVELTATATGFDIALWATPICEDLTGASCVAGADAGYEGDPETMTIINSGATPATYFVIVDGYSGCSAFSLDIGTATPAPVCGNGTLETVGGEVCDDNNTTDGDGCSATCLVEIGWTCTEASPSVCTSLGYPRIGRFDPAAAIPPQTGGPLAAGASAFFLIEFAAPVLLDGSVAATGTDADPDVYISGAAGGVASHTSTTLPEAWTGDSLAAGTYLIELRAYGALATYTMTLTTRTP